MANQMSRDWEADKFKMMLEVLGREEVSMNFNGLCNGYTIYFEESHVGISMGREELLRCGKQEIGLKDLAMDTVKKRDRYIMDLGKQVIEEKMKLSKKAKDRYKNDKAVGRSHGKDNNGYGDTRKIDERTCF